MARTLLRLLAALASALLLCASSCTCFTVAPALEAWRCEGPGGSCGPGRTCRAVEGEFFCVAASGGDGSPSDAAPLDAGACLADCSTLDGPCVRGVCNPATGICTQETVPDGTACEEAFFCSTGETCVAGACGGGVPRDCGDGVACTADTCDEGAGACAHVPDDDDADGYLDAACGGLDCNDATAAISPAVAETGAACFNGVDDDCDGFFDFDAAASDLGCTVGCYPSCFSCGGPGGCCAEPCTDPAGCGFSCPPGCRCEWDCTAGAGACSAGCGAGTSCLVNCDGRPGPCDTTCTAATSCVVACRVSPGACAVDCDAGANCLVMCDAGATAGDCVLTCDGGATAPVDCGGGRWTCPNAPCPA